MAVTDRNTQSEKGIHMALKVWIFLFVFCRRDTEASVCNNCKPGHCNGYYCSKCVDGYYLSSWRTCRVCKDVCTKCTSWYACSDCINGRYGPSCDLNCTDCKDGICSNAVCTYGCADGLYLASNNECTTCPGRCSMCTSATDCTLCSQSNYWGTHCQYYCNYYCTGNCNKNTGCSSCTDGYYAHYIDEKGGNECLICPNSCVTCTNSKYCLNCKSGYWGTYCESGCEGCFAHNCDKWHGCINGCIDGYFNTTTYQNGYKYYCTKCPGDCETCSSSTVCTKCKTGFNGTVCEHDCRACNGRVCSSVNGECLIDCDTNEYFDATRGICQPCPNHCIGCTSEASCNACIDGYWGSYCQILCPQNCKTCNKGSGHCTQCIDGFYGNKCKNRCKSNCKTCSEFSYCKTCKTGLFHKDHWLLCDCTEAYCSQKVEGLCTQCSDKTFYPKSTGCCPCSFSCKNNYCFANKTCLDCDDRKYGDYCNQSCDNYCTGGLCYRNGTCISCYAGFFGKTCRLGCSNAISSCLECYGKDASSVICTKCDRGKYILGNTCIDCSKNCKSVSASTCNSTSGFCLSGCEEGWFGDRCDTQCNVSSCEACSSSDPNVCKLCNDGHFLETNASCIPCPANCQNNCDKYNGSCVEGCVDGWWGIQCKSKCSLGCKQCDQFHSDKCPLCEKGFYGDRCEKNCSFNCAPGDGIQICNRSNGACFYGCMDGYWDYNCNTACGIGCMGHVCHNITGRCYGGCDPLYYGELCNTTCSKNCKTNTGTPSDRVCDVINGTCLYDCISGWFGDTCMKKCSKYCNRTICDRNNGTCIFGCTDGFTGSTCREASQLSAPGGTNPVALGVGAGAGVAVVVIIVGIVVAVLLLQKRRKASKFDTEENDAVQKSPDSKPNDQAQVYSNIADTLVGDHEIENSGVSNLVYANTSLTRLSEPPEYDNKTDMKKVMSEPVEVKETTREMTKSISDEVLAEEEITVEDASLEPPMGHEEVDNTYYNTAGKRVTLAKLPEYVKCKHKEEIIEEFENLPKGLLKAHRAAKQSKNAAKNRYKFIYPYDDSRVILTDGGSDYMNASYIEGYNKPKEYIASSGPFMKTYDTTPDFWRMIWQEKCETLVMLTNTFENGSEKCIKYWPERGTSIDVGGLQITCLTEDNYSDFTVRILTATKDKDVLNIRHLHFTAWPDKGVPHDVTSMIEFRQKLQSLHKDKSCPMIVHCSAGIGRTGTFIVLDMLTYEGEDRGSIDIFGCVATLRSQRCNMVQTPEQYEYLHHAILHSLTFDCRSIPGDDFLQNYNKLIKKNGGNSIIDQQFQQLQSTLDEMTEDEKGTIIRNRALPNKNRDSSEVPGDEYRVRLHQNRKPGASDYINAVYINGFRTRRQFIVAQTPLPSTLVDFLSLIYQEKCSCIVMMEEADVKDKNVGVYWPADNQTMTHGVFKVSCSGSNSTQHYTTKKLSLIYHGLKGEEEQEVNLFIFNNWSKDSAIPKTSDSMLQLVKDVDTKGRKANKEPTILVHCLSGAKRSCLYCAVAILIEKMEIEHEVSVVNTLRQIKARRRSAFPTIEQYKFCHQAVISYLQTFDIYSNFGLKTSEA